MLNYYKTIDNKICQIDKLEEGCWVNVVSPTEEEIQYLIDGLKLDAGFVRSSLDEEESSRIESEDDQTLLIIDTPKATTERRIRFYIRLCRWGLLLQILFWLRFAFLSVRCCRKLQTVWFVTYKLI